VHVLVDGTGLQVYGTGQWLEEKHGARSRRGWRKLHLALDADSGEISAHTLTDQETGDISQVEPRLDQTSDPIGQFTADCAYDGRSTYDAVIDIARRRPSSCHLAPTRSNPSTMGHLDKGTSMSPQSAETAG
jgi:Transposase DDE domain